MTKDRPMNVEKLSSFEQEELLRWFLHWVPQDKRRELMQRYPQHYNKLRGRKLMVVSRDLDDDERKIESDCA